MNPNDELVERAKATIGDSLILGSFTRNNCPPFKDKSDCVFDENGKHQPCMTCWNAYVDELARSLFAMLDKHGVVRLSENYYLPEAPKHYEQGKRAAYDRARSEMQKAGFRKVIPLTGGK